MLVVGHELDFGHAARVLLQVRDEFARSDFPDADLALETRRAHELVALRQADRCHAALVRIVNLPKERAVVDAVGADAAIRPPTQNHFISENCADWLHAANVGALSN